MKLCLQDKNNYKRNDTIKLDEVLSYEQLWKNIDDIIDKHKYSIIGYSIPELNVEDKKVIIHWIELFGNPSEAYIEICDTSDLLISIFENKVKRAKRRKNI